VAEDSLFFRVKTERGIGASQFRESISFTYILLYENGDKSRSKKN